MGLGAYAFAGAMQGFGASLVKMGEDKKKEAERLREEQREDKLRAEDRSYRETWRDEGRQYDASLRTEGREYEANQRALGARSDANAYRSVFGEGGFEAKPGTIGELLLSTESGGSFDTLFGFQNRDNGKFSGTRVSQMTIGELKEFSAPSGEYGQYVKGEVGRVATPMGAGQIVGSTLRRTAEAMGLPDDTVFTPEVQMSMVDYLASQALAGAKTQDQKRSALRGVWEGFKNVPDAKLDAAIASYEAGDIGVSFSNPNSDQYAAIEDPNTSAGARGVVVQDLARQRGLGEPAAKQKGLSATIKAEIRDWADANAIDQDLKDAFVLEVQRLVNDEGMTEDEAWVTARRTANKSEDVVTTEERFILPDREKVKEGTYDGTFGKPRGLGDPAETPDAPDMPKEPTEANAMPAPKTEAEFNALPKGTQFIDPEGNVRVKT